VASESRLGLREGPAEGARTSIKAGSGPGRNQGLSASNGPRAARAPDSPLATRNVLAETRCAPGPSRPYRSRADNATSSLRTPCSSTEPSRRLRRYLR